MDTYYETYSFLCVFILIRYFLDYKTNSVNKVEKLYSGYAPWCEKQLREMLKMNFNYDLPIGSFEAKMRLLSKISYYFLEYSNCVVEYDGELINPNLVLPNIYEEIIKCKDDAVGVGNDLASKAESYWYQNYYKS